MTCEGEPAVGVRVDLMESDSESFETKQTGNKVTDDADNSGIVDMVDFMNYTVTDANGFFGMSGSEVEVTGVEPYVKIFQKCDDGRFASRSSHKH